MVVAVTARANHAQTTLEVNNDLCLGELTFIVPTPCYIYYIVEFPVCCFPTARRYSPTTLMGMTMPDDYPELVPPFGPRMAPDPSALGGTIAFTLRCHTFAPLPRHIVPSPNFPTCLFTFWDVGRPGGLSFCC